ALGFCNLPQPENDVGGAAVSRVAYDVEESYRTVFFMSKHETRPQSGGADATPTNNSMQSARRSATSAFDRRLRFPSPAPPSPYGPGAAPAPAAVRALARSGTNNTPS